MSNLESETSVIVTTYNDTYADLYAAITSVLNQELPPKEIIVVDDGSDEKTAKDVVGSLQKKGSNKIKLYEKSNGGPSSARNHGIEHASGRFITFLDSDDEMFPDNVLVKETSLRGLSEEYFGVYGTYLKKPINKIHSYKNIDGLVSPDDVGKENGVPGGVPAFLFRRCALEQVGCFDEKLSHNEDFDLIIRLIRLSKKCKGNLGVGFIRNYRAGSLTRSRHFETYNKINKFLDKASELEYFAAEELNGRHKSNEIFLARSIMRHEPNKFAAVHHINKAFKYSPPESPRQWALFFVAKLYMLTISFISSIKK